MNTTISKQKIKWIRSLDKKKQRDKEQLFVAEGYKLVSELLSVFNCRYLVISNKISLPKALYNNVKETVVTNEEEIKKISNQKNPQGVLAVFEIIKHNYSYSDITQKTTLFLDDIQNPGNLGTIIRLADWFGIENIFCSQNTVDIFNPKTIQATMGAIARVKVHYVDKIDFLKNISQTTTVYGTFLDGKNIYQSPLQTSAVIVMGNEGNGISKEIEPFIQQKISIPSFPQNTETSESLNVGVATAIVVSEFRRQKIIR